MCYVCLKRLLVIDTVLDSCDLKMFSIYIGHFYFQGRTNYLLHTIFISLYCDMDHCLSLIDLCCFL